MASIENKELIKGRRENNGRFAVEWQVFSSLN
jgi:hypothetical protein